MRDPKLQPLEIESASAATSAAAAELLVNNLIPVLVRTSVLSVEAAREVVNAAIAQAEPRHFNDTLDGGILKTVRSNLEMLRDRLG